MFLWEIIPHRFLEWLLGIISLFTPLLFLVQFLWPVIIVAVFGFLVYRIQKRLYSPQNIIKRFVTDKKCPNCGNAVDMTKPFCPLCSHEIHIHCPHCHELTMKGMPYCSNCGTKLPESHEVIASYNHVLQDDFIKELEIVDVSHITGVIFHLQDGTSFVSRREAIIKIASYISAKL
jgi:rRNA maturation protein Nop10